MAKIFRSRSRRKYALRAAAYPSMNACLSIMSSSSRPSILKEVQERHSRDDYSCAKADDRESKFNWVCLRLVSDGLRICSERLRNIHNGKCFFCRFYDLVQCHTFSFGSVSSLGRRCEVLLDSLLRNYILQETHQPLAVASLKGLDISCRA